MGLSTRLVDDYDYWRESREFFRNLDREDEELPDVSSEREEWTPANKPLGRLGRRTNASTYMAGD